MPGLTQVNGVVSKEREAIGDGIAGTARDFLETPGVEELLKKLLGMLAKPEEASVKDGDVVCDVDVAKGESASGSVGSWADEMESFDSKSDGGAHFPSEAVAVRGSCGDREDRVDRVAESSGQKATFAAVASNAYSAPVSGREVAREAVSMQRGFMATHIRTAAARGMRAQLLELSGHRVPKSADRALAIVTRTAGTMPDGIVRGKDELRMLATVGDKALALAYTRRGYRMGHTVEQVQRFIARDQSDGVLARVFSCSALRKFVAFAPGVPEQSKVGATALEACVGLLDLFCGGDAVDKFVAALVLNAGVDSKVDDVVGVSSGYAKESAVVEDLVSW